MTETAARIKAKAVAYEIAAALGTTRAMEIMREAAKSLEDEVWRER